jgi:5'-3' exonuclease
MAKITLLIDGNYFLFRSFYVLPKTSGKSLDTKKEMDIFVRKLAIDFTSEMRKFRNIVDQVVFTVDSKSWRKDFYPEAEYKANRSEDSNVNWENFHKVSEEFKSILKKKGVILHKVNGAEGDDLVFAWSVNSNLRGKSTIVFSGDKDLIQLVNKNTSTDSFTLWYANANKRLVTYEGFVDWLKSEDTQVMDIFNMQKSINGDSFLKTQLKQIIKESKLEVEEVNAGDFGFKKVLTGDAGDNVKPVYYYTDINKNGQKRTYGVSEKKAETVLLEFQKKYGKFKVEFLYDESYQKHICNVLIKTMSATRMTYEQIHRNLQDNTSLVILHQKSIPEPIYNQLFEHVEGMEEKYIENFDLISTKEEFLKDTDYLDENFKTISSDFFDGEKVDSDMSFIKPNKPSDTIF